MNRLPVITRVLILAPAKSTFLCTKHTEPSVKHVLFLFSDLWLVLQLCHLRCFFSTVSTVSCFRCKATCSAVRIVYWKWEILYIDWKVSQSICSVQFSDRYRPSGLFAAPLVALLSMWLFSGVRFLFFFFLLTCEQRDKNWMWCQCVGGEVGYFFLFDSDLLVL